MSVWDTYKNVSGYNMLDSFLHPEDAYKAAEDKSQEGYNRAKKYQEPYWQGGVDQYGKLNTATDKLLDPAALENEWASGYETSPYAKQQLARNQTSGLEGASSMGLMGSSAAINNIQQGAGNIMAKDRQQYMDDLMKKYMEGIGLGKDLYSTGASTGQNLGNQSMQEGEDQASLAYGEKAAPGKLFENLVKTGAQVFGMPSGGGFGSGGFNQGMPQYMQNSVYGQ